MTDEPVTPGGELEAMRAEVARLRAEGEALRVQVQHLRGILQQAGDVIVATDLEGRITGVNRAAELLFGRSEAELVGTSPDALHARRGERSRLVAELERAPGGVIQSEVQVKAADGKRRWLGLSLAWLTDGQGQRVGTVSVSRDVTEHKALLEELERRSVTDKLTGLYNQSHFYHRLEVEKERSLRLDHELSLLLFDLDGFKPLNDTLGHLEGDKALRRVGGILFESVRKEVDSAFRYGGDEFAVLLPGAQLEHAERFAERVRRRIEEEPLHGVRASMGICAFDRQNRGAPLVERADEAMYFAKRQGGNRIAVWDPTRQAPQLAASVAPLPAPPP